MSDARQREDQRQAAAGDLDAEARALAARVRAFPEGWADVACEACSDLANKGPKGWYSRNCRTCEGSGQWPVQSRLELAAYCGDEAARRLLEWGPFHNDDGSTLGFFLHELRHRWPHIVSVRAACAAAELALKREWHRTLNLGAEPGPHWDRWHQSRRAVHAARRWCGCQTEEAREAWGSAWDAATQIGTVEPRWLPGPQENGKMLRDVSIAEATRLTSEKAVRAAICAELIGWALV